MPEPFEFIGVDLVIKERRIWSHTPENVLDGVHQTVMQHAVALGCGGYTVAG